MKAISLLIAALMFAVSATSALAATMGFSGTLEVHSVAASDRKAVFVVSGPCELLLAKRSDASGNAQAITSALDHTVIVLYRRGAAFATDRAWQQACEQFERFVGQHAHLETATPRCVWESADLTLISTEQLRALQSP